MTTAQRRALFPLLDGVIEEAVMAKVFVRQGDLDDVKRACGEAVTQLKEVQRRLASLSPSEKRAFLEQSLEE